MEKICLNCGKELSEDNETSFCCISCMENYNKDEEELIFYFPDSDYTWDGSGD
jgi:predicted amidophosphoribosyltransferase